MECKAETNFNRDRQTEKELERGEIDRENWKGERSFNKSTREHKIEFVFLLD